MPDEPGRGEPTPAPRGRRYRRHALELPDGGRLVLGVDGLIERFDTDGATTQSWSTDDPGWPGQAIRFGLRPEATTVTPPGRHVQGTKPPS
jgi:hypothetical protein